MLHHVRYLAAHGHREEEKEVDKENWPEDGHVEDTEEGGEDAQGLVNRCPSARRLKRQAVAYKQKYVDDYESRVSMFSKKLQWLLLFHIIGIPGRPS